MKAFPSSSVTTLRAYARPVNARSHAFVPSAPNFATEACDVTMYEPSASSARAGISTSLATVPRYSGQQLDPPSMGVSQSAFCVSQLANPSLQMAGPQASGAHEGYALATAHTRPQAPQL